VVLAECTPEQVTVVTPAGDVVEGGLLPTSELDLHLSLYDATDTLAVVHAHAPFSTAVACVLDELPVLHYQQLLLGGTIRVASYATFGTPELATAVRMALTDRQAALLLEWLAALHHRASAFGTPRVLTDEQQADVITQALTLKYGTTQENP
jgi:L-fuculose-phosphate aldolase